MPDFYRDGRFHDPKNPGTPEFLKVSLVQIEGLLPYWNPGTPEFLKVSFARIEGLLEKLVDDAFEFGE